MLAYTNASTIVSEQFVGADELDGVFSGLDPEQRTYDVETWQYEGAEVQAASGKRDLHWDARTGAVPR